jgi:hypothetical protein
MSTVTDTRSRAQSSPLVSSTAFKTFTVVFAIASPIIYVICEMQNWPLFTYHPGTNRMNLGWAAAVRNEGPAMYWYGWTANMLIGSAILGALATFLPERFIARIPLSLVWIAPLAAIPILIYALRFFWRW